ncbi:hypothetical protein G4B88_030010 [Cannabis sativa]|uniref:Reverse transcriptase zinc-binding domain-containing protein n=1 Tax=Cannabis sativa TaxID=3483 RepID=A0A7J6GB40_CANSA|nr:hypothetical protein G4B88_030010 [Cannabis sativa]
MVKRLFNRSDAKAILNIQLPEDDTKDGWMWMGEPSGLFSIRLACRTIRGGTSITQADTKWKIIWKSAIHPRLKLIWWQLERDVFQTRGKLANFMDLNTVHCPMCGEDVETIFHLLWKCSLAKAIWFNSSMGLRVELIDVNGWDQWKDWFMVDTHRPPNLTFLEIIVTALCVVETVWQERNSIVHSQLRRPISKVAFTVNSKIRDHIMVASNAVVDFCEWRPPPESWLCCNYDIAYDEDGVILATVRSSTTDLLIGEGLAVCMAAELMIEMRAKYVIFQSDNVEVTRDLSTDIGIDIHFKLTHLRVCTMYILLQNGKRRQSINRNLDPQGVCLNKYDPKSNPSESK